MTPDVLPGVLSAGVVALVATRLAEVLGRRRRLLDIPNDRSSHVIPTPRLGGLGIMAGSVAGWAALGGPSDPEGSLLLAVALALGAVGLLDDVGRTSVAGKYLAQLVAAVAVVAIVGPQLRVAVGDIELAIGGIPAAILTAVGLTAVVNAVNFMDGIDGIIGSVMVVAGLAALALVAPDAAPLMLAVAAATAGFLAWNVAPASIFMGDSGSQFLGLVVGATLLRGPSGVVEVVPAGLLLAALLADTGFTLVRRARAGRDLFAGHREHLYQRLVQAGRSHREVAAGYAAATAVLGLAAVAWTRGEVVLQVGIVVALVVAAIAFVRLVAALERRAGEAADPSTETGPDQGSGSGVAT